MAFQHADPHPFIPEGFEWNDIPDREFMCRAMAPLRLPATNEDLAIITLVPLPGNQLSFAAVSDIVIEFLIAHRVNFRRIMPSHLGQAFVRLTHAYDRDNLVRRSPRPYVDIQISFAKHNEGRNWRRVFFNDDCWMMLLGFPDDYKSERHIQNAISDFGKVILWEESEFFPGKIMVRARVKSVQEVPRFIVYSNSPDLNGESWTIQCEVMQHHPLDQGPPIVDPVPEELELEHVVPFDFLDWDSQLLSRSSMISKMMRTCLEIRSSKATLSKGSHRCSNQIHGSLGLLKF